MRKTWTVTVDVQESDMVSAKDLAEEMEYWADWVDKALALVTRDYNEAVDKAQYRVDYEAIDFTNISIAKGGDE